MELKQEKEQHKLEEKREKLERYRQERLAAPPRSLTPGTSHLKDITYPIK